LGELPDDLKPNKKEKQKTYRRYLGFMNGRGPGNS
jgi:hypothetical protein